jgi:putative hydrolase of the HAD superfamily
MIKAIIFDCFGVIYVDAAQVAYNLLAIDHDRQFPRMRDIFEARNRGLISQQAAQAEAAETMGVAVERWRELLESFHGRDEAVLQYIARLKKDYKTALLTNLAPGRLMDHFTREELNTYFDVAAASGDIGFAKPDEEAFRYVLERLDVLPQESVFIDDRENYLAGAISLGIHTILYQDLVLLQTQLGTILSADQNNET